MYYDLLIDTLETINGFEIKQRTSFDENYWIECVTDRSQTCTNKKY